MKATQTISRLQVKDPICVIEMMYVYNHSMCERSVDPAALVLNGRDRKSVV